MTALAPVLLVWAQPTGADLAKTNVNGGAIAIGHPLGGGMANATIIERRG